MMPKLPPINEIIRTIGGREIPEPRGGITRRKFLQAAADRAMPDIGQGTDNIDTILGQANVATKFFKKNRDLWDPRWGKIEDAEPEDIIDAFINIEGET